MKTTPSFHPAQVAILRELLFKPNARFKELNTTGLSTDHFTFHIKALLDAGIIAKQDDTYHLTAQGKEFANTFDVDSQTTQIEKQAKLGVNICCIKEENGELFFLLQQRLKQPYYGYHGFMTGKIKWGESVYETAERELEEEMGLKADLTLMSVKHKLDYDQNKTLLEDKFFFKFLAENPRGDLLEEITGGKNMWVNEKDVLKLDPIFHDLPEVFQEIKDFLATRKIQFIEKSYTVDGY